MLTLTLPCGLGSASCAPSTRLAEHTIAVRIESDPGRALAGARVLYQGKVAGTSNAAGLVPLSIQASEGSAVSLGIECPNGYHSDSTSLLVTLRRANERDRHAEYAVRCAPRERTVVIAVRAEHAKHLPIVQLGREVGRLDDSGAAHVVLKSAPETTLELGIDTSESPALRPRNPTTRFRVGHGDEILVFNQSFSVETPKLARGPRKPSGPVRIR